MVDFVHTIMKHTNSTALLFAAILVLLCPTQSRALLSFDQEPAYVGDYLDMTDVQRIGHALDTAATRTPVQWENGRTGYQYSLMVFTTGETSDGTIRRFSILAIEPSGKAELLELVGRSEKKSVWRIEAEIPASPVGTAARMQLEQTPVPAASTSSGDRFKGFMIME